MTIGRGSRVVCRGFSWEVAGEGWMSQLGKTQATEFYFEFTQNHFSHPQHQNPHPRILTRTLDLQPATPDPRHAAIIQTPSENIAD